MDIPRSKINKLKRFFISLERNKIEEYMKYWDSITPTSKKEVFHRWLFAAMSIHTGYENNVKQFNALKNLSGAMKKQEIAERLKGGGMQNRKATLVANICNTKAYESMPENSWRQWRDHHREQLWGIGNAKISFVAEMLAPSNTDIICIDRHILKAFGQDPESAPKPDDYHYMENIWNDLSRYSYCPPAIARFIYWDIHIQQKSNSRYWSKTLEKS